LSWYASAYLSDEDYHFRYVKHRNNQRFVTVFGDHCGKDRDIMWFDVNFFSVGA